MNRFALVAGVGVFGVFVGPWSWPGEARAQPPGGPLPANAAAAPNGMVVLFDGRTLDGWKYDPKVWTVKDGAMRGTGKYGQIFTKDDYGDFRLLVTSRVVFPQENTGNGHLGILFWGDRPKEGTWGMAGALQVQPPHGAMWDYRTNKNVRPTRVVPRQGLLYRDWHTTELLVKLKTGDFRMAVDGVEIIRYTHPDPKVLKKGPIGMQLHQATAIMEYNDIRVEVEPKEGKLITVK
jgi:Domain of Unknown Function (DUF1080)